MEPLRVLMWHWGRRGGGPRYTFELARALRGATGLELHLSLSRQSEYFEETAALGYPGWHVDTYRDFGGLIGGSLRIPRMRRAFEAYLRENRIDVVHCTMVHLWNVAFLDVLRRAGVRYVFTVHDASAHPGEENRLRDWALRRELAAAERIVTLSHQVKRELQRIQGVAPDRIAVIPHGVFDYIANPAARHWTGGRAFRLLFFGRLMAYKGLPLLAEAMRILARQGMPVELVVAGPGTTKPWTELFGGLPNVRLDIRWVPEGEIAAIVGAADAVVQPYVEASQSGVLPIALSGAIPCIVTPVGALPEQVAHEETGLVCREVSAQGVAEAIRRLVEEPGLYDRLSAGSLQASRTTFGWSHIADQVHALLADVARRSACPAEVTA